ncbi:MAG: hypothetical protein M3443_01400 [Actinomycetota bacterium]|nr:hypothetical protein [Actinomycetota bacterium]
MNAVLYPLCAAIAWICLLFKIPALRQGRRHPATISIALFYLFMGLTFTISDPRVWAIIDRGTSIPNLALLLSQGCVMGVAGTQLAALTWWIHPADRARPLVWRRSWAIVGVFAAMIVLFAMAGLTEPDTTTAAVRYAGHGLYSVYLMLYVTAFAVAEFALVVYCLRYAKIIDVRWLRAGLRLAAAGGIGGLIYVAARYADVVAGPLGLDPQKWEFAARLGAGLGGILTLIGWSLPGWGPQLGALRGWLGRHRDYRRLYPLWSALHQANPQIALDPDSGHRVGWRDLDFLLHRRVIEIRDGQRWLRPYLDQDTVDAATDAARASGLDGDDLRAHTEAAQIATALKASEIRVGATPAVSTGEAGGQDHASEVAWLVRVARVFTTLDRT